MRYFVILLCMINMLSCTDDPENESEVQCPIPTTEEYAQLIVNNECREYTIDLSFSNLRNNTNIRFSIINADGFAETFIFRMDKFLTKDSTYDISTMYRLGIIDFDSIFDDAFLPTSGETNTLTILDIPEDYSYIEAELKGHLTKNKIDPFFTGSYPDSLVISSGRFRILNSD